MVVSSAMLPSTTLTKAHKNTRPASFYDKHLSPRLILKHVRYLDSLVSAIAGTVDNAILDAYTKALDKSRTDPPEVPLQRLPQNSEGDLFTKRQIQRRAKDIAKNVVGEAGVSELYLLTSAQYCLPIASTIKLHPFYHDWTSIMLKWTKDVRETGWAIADGTLLLKDIHSQDEESKEEFRLVTNYTDPEIQPLLDDIRQKNATLATWEVKSLTVGDEEVFTAIMEFGFLGGFKWKSCRGNCKKPKEHHAFLLASPDDYRAGPDSLHPPWVLPAEKHSSTASRLPTRQSERIAHLGVALPGHDFAGPSGATNMPQPDWRLTSSPSASDGERNGTGNGETSGRKRKGSNKGSERKRKKPDDESYEPPNGERREVNAQSFLQQAWAQAVHAGNTILVLHSGNHELIGVRHRASQTLYISDVIKPWDCNQYGYGRIQVGIYIAAIEDALDRRKQDKAEADLKAVAEEGPSRPPDDIGRNNNPDDEGPRKGGHRKNPKKRESHGQRGNQVGAEGKSGSTRTSTLTQALHDASTPNVAFMHFCYGAYASPHPATFIRQTPLVTSPEQAPTPPPSPGGSKPKGRNDSIDVIIRSHFHAGSTGIVHTGTMEVESSGTPIPVAVKLAFSEDDKETLEHEHRIYSRLQSANVQGIPHEFGLFVDEELVDGCEGPYALIMTFAGPSLANLSTGIPYSVKMSLLETFRAIHKAGVIHRDVCLRNMCAETNGEAFVIDFSHAMSTTNRRARAAEMEKVHKLLNIKQRKPRGLKLRRSLRLMEKKRALEAIGRREVGRASLK